MRQPSRGASSRPRGGAHYILLGVALLCALSLTWRTVGLDSTSIHGESLRRRLQTFDDTPPGGTVRLAFFVQISAATIPHLPRLLKRIWEDCNVYAIHIDAKVSAADVRNLRAKLDRQNPRYASNVHWMDPELITYRGVSMLLNTINGMQLLLEKGEKWDFFINLSGSDYPLLTVARQRELLGTASRNHNFFSMAPAHRWKDNTKYRYAHFYVDEALSFRKGPTQVVQIDRKNPLESNSGFVYTNAEAWMINSRRFCEYVVKSPAARKLLLTFAFSVESSEHYFSTLAYNSKYNASIVHSALRQVIWSHEGRSAGQHPYYVDEKDGNGKFVFRDAVVNSVQFYTRKFRHPNSPLMDEIDAVVENVQHVSAARKHFDWAVQVARSRAAEQPARMPFD